MKQLAPATDWLWVCLLVSLIILSTGPVYAGQCWNPTGNEGDRIYNGDYHTWQFCNGTGWLAFGGGSACSASGGSAPPTGSSSNGYFVMSQSTWNGNLGGLTGADSLCLTELTTNTGWMGYSTANGNGQLTSSKVHAFLCDGAICTGLMPLTTYYFADANNAGHGGASFTTDSSGIGPNDSANWSASNRFGGTYTMWTNWTTTSNTAWLNSSGVPCLSNGSPWISSTDYHSPTIGNTNNTTSSRWDVTAGACSSTYNLICVVNP